MSEHRLTRGISVTRREIVMGLGVASAVAVSGWPVRPAAAATYVDDGDAGAAIKAIAGDRTITAGRVKLTLPELAENGNVVSTVVEVDSPMTSADHVKTIHIIASKNPLSNVAHFHLGPRAGRARVQTNIRLATTQTVTALAEMSDGSLWSGTATVLVTLSACIDGG